MQPNKPEVWNNCKSNKVDDNLVVVTISPKWYKLACSYEKDEKNIVSKIVLFQEELKKKWKGLDLPINQLPALGYMFSKMSQPSIQIDDCVQI